MGIKVCLPYAQISKLSLNKLLILFYYILQLQDQVVVHLLTLILQSECDVKVTYKKHTNV